MSETPADSPVAAAIRVLVAEDEAIIRLDLVETLESEGYEVVASTGRGDDAIRLATELEPDVALLDIKMPGASGIDVARQISEVGSSAVVILTAFGQRELIADAKDAGVMAYLVKPYRRSDLIPAVELARARFRDLQAAEGHVDDLQRRLRDRGLIEKAKGHLIDHHSFSEADAFGFIQRTAMSGRRKMVDVASEVLEGSLSP